MPSSLITYEYDWFPEPMLVADSVDVMAVELEDLHEPLMASLVPITRDQQQRFNVGGPGWAPWAVKGGMGPSGEYTKDYKGGSSVLINTTALYQHVGEPESYLVTDNTIMYLPLREPADEVLQTGSGVRNIYDRPFMGLDEAGMEGVMVVFELWLDGIIGGARLLPGESLVPAGSRVSIRGKGGRFVA